jgi:predicted DNA-binding protein
MKTAISLPDRTAEYFDNVARKHGMTRSEFYRRAAEHYAHDLDGADLTAEIDAAIDDVGQPGDDTAAWRRAANSRLVETGGEW